MPAQLLVIGLGPGDPALLPPEARNAIAACQCLIGYDLYLSLVPGKLKKDKTILTSGMRQETARCDTAIDCALDGKTTALLSSGDPGIYAMASLLIERLAKRQLLETIPLRIIPGIPALCAAAALLGAPIGHDFASISLSDLLTPQDIITSRLRAALSADFVCILYNPRSHNRPHCLADAIKIVREYRQPDCPVGLVRNAARANESTSIQPLCKFAPDTADMLSIVIIGNSQTRQLGPYMLTPRGYTAKYG